MDLDRPDAERAQWDQARKVRLRQQADVQARLDEQAAAASRAVAPRSRRGVLIGLVATLSVVAVVGAAVAVVHRRSSAEPDWVHQLGLESPHSASGAAPSRLGSAPTGTGATTTADNGTIDGQSARRPAINTTGEDFDRIWRQIEVLEDWLLLHPEPSAASEIYVAGTEPSDQLVQLLTQLQQDRQTIEVKDYRILGVTIDSRPSGSIVVLHYADTYRDRVQLDAAGHVISDDPYDGRARLWSLTLRRGNDSRWRVEATSFIGFGDPVAPQ